MEQILSARDGSPPRSARGYGPVVCFDVWSSQTLTNCVNNRMPMYMAQVMMHCNRNCATQNKYYYRTSDGERPDRQVDGGFSQKKHHPNRDAKMRAAPSTSLPDGRSIARCGSNC
jgi:hypothetical protein